MTSDDRVRVALAEDNLEDKIVVGNGHRVKFRLDRPEIERTIELLKSLERRRLSKELPRILPHVDKWTFSNAIVDFQQALGVV